jgi:hypothetical protein
MAMATSEYPKVDGVTPNGNVHVHLNAGHINPTSPLNSHLASGEPGDTLNFDFTDDGQLAGFSLMPLMHTTSLEMERIAARLSPTLLRQVERRLQKALPPHDWRRIRRDC